MRASAKDRNHQAKHHNGDHHYPAGKEVSQEPHGHPDWLGFGGRLVTDAFVHGWTPFDSLQGFRPAGESIHPDLGDPKAIGSVCKLCKVGL